MTVCRLVANFLATAETRKLIGDLMLALRAWTLHHLAGRANPSS